MRQGICTIALSLALGSAASAMPIDTQILMLTGRGPADAVPWDFSIDGGMRAGEKATIQVPSNWQQQGFGHYQYGVDRARNSHDHAIYHRRFDVPPDWKGKTIRLVFDAVMTDTLVRVNGVVAGPLHQGGFNRFSFDVTKLVKVGAPNDLVVEVSESSAAPDTDIAERRGDYWAFGGIYRPVWLEALPAEAIAHVAIDGQASGTIIADVALADPHSVTRVTGQVVDAQGTPVGAPFETSIPAGGTGMVRLTGKVNAPRLWSAETPNLYFLDATLFSGTQAIHHVRTRFGFRTFEVREGEGLFLNGQKIILKGVDRHSFRPDTGRALNPQDSYADVRLIRGMNMNAVRMSHYSPEESFLEAADELGLYVLDELSGWQHAHDTQVGRRLVRELVDRDVNHPSILFWDNGNEGGFNRELDGEFALFDPQRRKILHPWETHDGIDTKHYPKYDDFVRRLAGPTLVMPTEFQHGLFDGGAGSGLDDYWNALLASPRGAGGFIWSFADEGIARTDKGGQIDNFGSYAPDGIVSARHEPEPSYFTIKAIWSPVQIRTPTLDAGFDGRLTVTNRYDFTPTSALSFRWEWLRFPAPLDRRTEPVILSAGDLGGPAIPPHAEGVLKMGQNKAPAGAQALRVIARQGQEEIASWVWSASPVPSPSPAIGSTHAATPRVERAAGVIRLVAGDSVAEFDTESGLLRSISRAGHQFALGAGPRLVLARTTGEEPTLSDTTARPGGGFAPAAPGMANIADVDLGLTAEEGWAAFSLQISADGQHWTTVFDGTRTPRDPTRYTFPPQRVAAIRVENLTSLRGALQVRGIRLGYQGDRFALPQVTASPLATGSASDPATGKPVAWLEAPGAGGLERVHWTMQSDGTLRLDYSYRLSGPMLYHGVGFDAPLDTVTSARAMIAGPWPVWKNRVRGPQLGVYDIAGSATRRLSPVGHAGYFAAPRWLRLDTARATLVITPAPGTPFLQLGAKMADYPTTSPDFPSTTVSFLQAIPAMGNKFDKATDTGPSGAATITGGVYRGTILFDLANP